MERFTERYIASLRPRDKRYDLREADGFTVRISPTGVKTFCALYERNGKKQRITYGQWPAKKLADAHKEHRELLQQLDKKEDPAAERRKRRTALTVEDLVEEYIQARKGKLRASTHTATARILRVYVVAALGSRKVTDVTRRDLKELARKVTDRGAPQMANAVVAKLSALWSWALEEELVESSPVAGMKKPNGVSTRSRVLEEGEIRNLWFALDAAVIPGKFGRPSVGSSVCRGLKFVLVSGQRPGEVAGMTWEEVSKELTGWWWTLPEDRVKTKRLHRVPLTDLALEIMGSPRTSGPVFESPYHPGRPLVRDSLVQALVAHWRHWKLRAPVWAHDLRRTARSGLAKLGIPREIADRVVNHVQTGMARVYDQHGYQAEKRYALEAWSRRIQDVLKAQPEERDKLVSFPAAQ